MVNGLAVHLEDVNRGAVSAMTSSIATLNARAVDSSHAPGSLTTYASAWRSWSRCARFFQFSDLCQEGGSMMPVDRCVSLLELYVGYECGLRQMSPRSIASTYIPGIACTLDRMHIFSHFRSAATHPIVKYLIGGFLRIWETRHPICGQVKIPFTLTLALHAERLLASGSVSVRGLDARGHTARTTMERERVGTALWVGIFFLLRKGEFLPSCQSSNHCPFRRSNLRFWTEERTEIPYDQVGQIPARWVSVTVVFSKADQSGRGRILHHHASLNGTGQCIVRRLESYIAVTRTSFGAKAEDALFDIPGFPTLTTETLTAVMRATCGSLGLPSSQVSAHSLRYGGATTLAAAGFPEYIIAFYGGWAPNSKSMKRYIQPTDDIIRIVSGHMSLSRNSESVQAVVNQLLAHRVPQSLCSGVPCAGRQGGGPRGRRRR